MHTMHHNIVQDNLSQKFSNCSSHHYLIDDGKPDKTLYLAVDFSLYVTAKLTIDSLRSEKPYYIHIKDSYTYKYPPFLLEPSLEYEVMPQIRSIEFLLDGFKREYEWTENNYKQRLALLMRYLHIHLESFHMKLFDNVIGAFYD